ncbi:MAG: hypothetical protein ACRDHF_06255 [Tepidiformaceae bacterium]
MRTEKLLPSAEAFYAEANEEDRAELKRIVRNLCQDPTTNNRTTFAFPVPPAIMTLYADDRFWVLYHLPNGDELNVVAFGRAGDKVRIRRG